MDDKRIEEIWNEIEDTDPEISTERLMVMTCERVSEEADREYDAGDISAALYRLHLKNKKKGE